MAMLLDVHLFKNKNVWVVCATQTYWNIKQKSVKSDKDKVISKQGTRTETQ